MVEHDRRITVREISLELELSKWSVNKILTDDLGFTKRCARWVPRLLTQAHKDERIRCAREFLRSCRANPGYLNHTITTDETWIYFTTPEMKEQSKQWIRKGAPAPTKAKVVRSAKKVMVIPFFDSEGLIYTHYVPPNQTVNAQYFIGVLTTFLDHLRRKRPHLKTGNWVLHLDNARPHTAAITRNFLASKGVVTISHPPYSPDLSPPDFFLFPEVKRRLAGMSFGSVAAIKTAWEGLTNPGSVIDFKKGMDGWIYRWQKCIEIEGGYVEK